MFEAFIFPAISFGLSASVLPGALQAFLFNMTLRHGLRRGLFVVLSPLLTDAPIILVMTFLLGQVPDALLQVIRIAGGLLLLNIAREAWRQYRAGQIIGGSPEEDMPDEPVSIRYILVRAVAMNYLTPGPYLFWGTITGPMLVDALGESVFVAFAFLLGFYGTFLGMLALMAVAISRLGSLNSSATRWITLVTIILLVWFGTALIAEALSITEIHRVVGAVIAVGLVCWQLLSRVRTQHREFAS